MSAEPSGFVHDDRVAEIRAYVESGKSWNWQIAQVAFLNLFSKLDAKDAALIRQAESLTQVIDGVNAKLLAKHGALKDLVEAVEMLDHGDGQHLTPALNAARRALR